MGTRSFFGRRKPRTTFKGRVKRTFELAPKTRKAVAAVARSAVRSRQETKWAANNAEGPITLYGAIDPIGGPTQVYPAICPLLS